MWQTTATPVISLLESAPTSPPSVGAWYSNFFSHRPHDTQAADFGGIGRHGLWWLHGPLGDPARANLACLVDLAIHGGTLGSPGVRGYKDTHAIPASISLSGGYALVVPPPQGGLSD